MDRRMAMRRILQDVIAQSSGWLTHHATSSVNHEPGERFQPGSMFALPDF